MPYQVRFVLEGGNLIVKLVLVVLSIVGSVISEARDRNALSKMRKKIKYIHMYKRETTDLFNIKGNVVFYFYLTYKI